MFPKNLNVNFDRCSLTCQPRLGQGCHLVLTVTRHRLQSGSGVKNKASRNISNYQSFGNHAGLHTCWLKSILMNFFAIRLSLLRFVILWHQWQVANCDPYIFTVCQNVLKKFPTNCQKHVGFIKKIFGGQWNFMLWNYILKIQFVLKETSHTVCFLSSCRGNCWNGFSQCSLFLKFNAT